MSSLNISDEMAKTTTQNKSILLSQKHPPYYKWRMQECGMQNVSIVWEIFSVSRGVSMSKVFDHIRAAERWRGQLGKYRNGFHIAN